MPVGAPCFVVAAAVVPARLPSGASRIRCVRRCSLALAPSVFGALCLAHSVRSALFAASAPFCLAHSVHPALFAGTGAHFVWRTQCTQRCSLALAHIVLGALSALSVVRWHWRTFCLAHSVHSALFAGTGADCLCKGMTCNPDVVGEVGIKKGKHETPSSTGAGFPTAIPVHRLSWLFLWKPLVGRCGRNISNEKGKT